MLELAKALSTIVQNSPETPADPSQAIASTAPASTPSLDERRTAANDSNQIGSADLELEFSNNLVRVIGWKLARLEKGLGFETNRAQQSPSEAVNTSAAGSLQNVKECPHDSMTPTPEVGTGGGAAANRPSARNVLREQCLDIKMDLATLDVLISQEQHRQTICQRITAIMMMRYDCYVAMQQALASAEKALRLRIVMTGQFENSISVPAAALSVSEQTAYQGVMCSADAIRSAALAQLVRARDALYSLIALLAQRFDMLSERLFPTPSTRQAVADKKSEEIFKKRCDSMLFYLRGDVRFIIESGALLDVCRNMRKGGVSAEVMPDIGIMRDIKIGETLTLTILSSGSNCGVVPYKPDISECKFQYAVSSNLTMVRSIASYLDALAIANFRHLATQNIPYDQFTNTLANSSNRSPFTTFGTFDVSKGPDGSYTMLDPERKLFSFLASTPTACAHPPYPADNASATSLMDTRIGRMTIADYSSTFPGGTNQMEFESKIAQSGANILKVRFLKQHDASMLRPDQSKVSAYIEDLRSKLKTEQTYVEMPSFTDMSTADVHTYLDNMTVAMEEQMKLLAEDRRLLGVLQKWEHPAFMVQRLNELNEGRAG